MFACLKGVSRFVSIALLLVLAACGGGGGSGGGGATVLNPVFTVSTNALIFSAEEGDDVLPQTVSGSVTGATAPVYLIVSYTNSAISYVTYAQTDATSGRIDVTVKGSTTLTPGLHSDVIRVYACYDLACTQPLPDSPKRIDVSYTIAPRNPAPHLQVSDLGVAFASVPSGAHLSRTLRVKDATGDASGWTAVSSQSWLTVTSSGISPGDLNLTANVGSLAPGFYEARVTVSSSNSAIVNSESVRVGLYVSNTASANVFVNGTGASNSIVDPIRPYLYSIAASTVYVNHVYTGALVATINIVGSDLRSVAVSHDGSHLYVVDAVSKGIVTVDLDQQTVVGTNTYPQYDNPSGDYDFSKIRIAYARVARTPVLLLNRAQMPFNASMRFLSPVVNADTGEVIGEAGYEVFDALMAVSRDGSAVYRIVTGLSGMLPIPRHELRANSHGKVWGVKTHEYSINAASARDIAVNADGTRIYVAFHTSADIVGLSYNGAALVRANDLPAVTLPNVIGITPANVEVDPYGRIVTHYYTSGLRVFSTAETLLQEWVNLVAASAGSAIPGSLRVSSDGLRAIGNSYMLDLPQ